MPHNHTHSHNRPSSRLLNPDNSSSSKRPHSLKLNGLPRFHPANFPGTTTSSSNSSTVSSPNSTCNSPPAPLSPRQQYGNFTAHQRQMSDAQRHLYVHQRDTVTLNRYHAAYSPVYFPPPSSGSLRSPKPTSPRLDPLGSPGLVTPLELEERDGYLFATNSASNDQLSEESKHVIVDGYIRKEASTSRPPSVADGRQSPRPYPTITRGDFTKHRSNLSR